MRFNLTFSKPTYAQYYKADGTKVVYALPHDPDVDQIVEAIHTADEQAIILMGRESDGRIHIIPGKDIMTDEARNALMTDVDAWLAGLDSARYTGKKDTMSFGTACMNGGCIAQPPKKTSLNDAIKDGTRTTILNWTRTAVAPAPAAPAPGGTNPNPNPAPGGTNPNPNPTPGGTNPAPAPGGTNPNPNPAPAPGGTNPNPAPGGTNPNPAPAPAPNPNYAAGANAFRAAFEALGGNPVSWTRGARI